MHLRILPDHQKLFFKKDIFFHVEWLKACFDALPHTCRPTETFFQKRYFLLSGAVTNVFWCIFANFHTTRNLFSEKIFLTARSVFKTCFDAFSHTSRPPETFCQKRYFLPSGVVKSVFWCICTYFQNTRNFFSKEIFLNVWGC